MVENYEEAKKVEAYLDSIAKHTPKAELKHTTSKRPLLLTKPREEHSNELDSVVKMVQKLSNNVGTWKMIRELVHIESHSTLITRKGKRVNRPSYMGIIMLC